MEKERYHFGNHFSEMVHPLAVFIFHDNSLTLVSVERKRGKEGYKWIATGYSEKGL